MKKIVLTFAAVFALFGLCGCNSNVDNLNYPKISDVRARFDSQITQISPFFYGGDGAILPQNIGSIINEEYNFNPDIFDRDNPFTDRRFSDGDYKDRATPKNGDSDDGGLPRKSGSETKVKHTDRTRPNYINL